MSNPKGWFGDPYKRHLRRYFDGEKWTDQAQTATGEMITDPIEPVATITPSGEPWWKKKLGGKVPVWAAILGVVMLIGAISDGSDDTSPPQEQSAATTVAAEATSNSETTLAETTEPAQSETTVVEAAESDSETADSETGFESSLSSDASLNNEEGQTDETERWLTTLEAISLEEEQPRSGYDRDSWPHWRDTNGTGCDSRKDLVMLYAFEDAVLDYDDCSVSGGVWYSWFDGVTTDNSSSFDVDHIVSLAEAHDSGGANWPRSKKQEFANDARNLVLVSASSNRSKSDKDVAEWRPMQEVWCITARQVLSVKYSYGLSVDQAEFDSLAKMLLYCGREGQISWWVEDLTMPRSAPSTTAAVPQTTTATQPGAPSLTEDEIPPNPGNTKNCDDFDTYQEAKEWFDYYFPYYGDVARLDGNDNDGLPCESRPGGPSS